MPKHVVFILGDPEYHSHETMPSIARELKEQHGMHTTVCISSRIEDHPDYPQSDFPGLEALLDADLAVTFTRFRVLPERQMQIIDTFLRSGRPLVGLRTATHSFRFPKESPYSSWNDGFGRDLFGTPWRWHYGGSSTTAVQMAPHVAEHPILRGVEESFSVRSWLYYVLPLPDTCTQLLHGRAVGHAGPRELVENPVAWTNTYNGGRIFYTSLGHPDDFAVPSVRNLVINGIQWALGDVSGEA